MLPIATFVFRIALLIMLFVLIDLYVFQGFRTVLQSVPEKFRTSLRYLYWLLPILLFSVTLFFAAKYSVSGSSANTKMFPFFFGLFVLFYVPKLFWMVLLIAEDVFRLGAAGFKMIANMVSPPDPTPAPGADLVLSRSQFLSQLGLIAAGIPFGSIAYGLIKGKYDYQVKRETIYFPNLPKAFDGLTIAQISDVHSGSFDDQKSVERGIEMINQLEADLVVFTGDLVNNVADEMEPWIPVFSKIKSKIGNFSILGNHDYGDYVKWDSKEAKQANLNRLVKTHEAIGFQLLRNQHHILERNGEKIAIVGVENWGLPPFPQYGNLNAAVNGAENVPFKVLLSHDPSHWEAETIQHASKPDLTLAGHTHGMQFGVEIAGFKWSPVRYKYPRWAGLYQEGLQYLYVNRGFGFLGFPGRVGILPEITLLTLKTSVS